MLRQFTGPPANEFADRPYSLLLAWLVDKLARSPGFAHRVLAQRDWHDESPTMAIKWAGPQRGRTITP